MQRLLPPSSSNFGPKTIEVCITINFAPWKRFLQERQNLNRSTTHASSLWSIQANFQMVTLLTLKNVFVHWDRFTPIRSLKGKFLVYTNHLSISVWLVELILAYTVIFHCTQCNHSKVNLSTPELSWNVLKASYSKLTDLNYPLYTPFWK